MNKKAVNLLTENVVYLMLVLIFVGFMLFGISRAGSQATLDEQINAKKIALIINKAKPGTEIELSTFEMNLIAKKNKFGGQIISIDNDNNKVNVQLVNGKGYDYLFFNDVDIAWNIVGNEKKCNGGTGNCLILKIGEKNE